MGDAVVAVATATVAGDSDLFEHTRLLAKFFKARVFFGTTVAKTGIDEIWTVGQGSREKARRRSLGCDTQTSVGNTFFI